jgi:hypothetical protein
VVQLEEEPEQQAAPVVAVRLKVAVGKEVPALLRQRKPSPKRLQRPWNWQLTRLSKAAVRALVLAAAAAAAAVVAAAAAGAAAAATTTVATATAAAALTMAQTQGCTGTKTAIWWRSTRMWQRVWA